MWCWWWRQTGPADRLMSCHQMMTNTLRQSRASGWRDNIFSGHCRQLSFIWKTNDQNPFIFFFLEFRVASFSQYWLHSLGGQKCWPTLWDRVRQAGGKTTFFPAIVDNYHSFKKTNDPNPFIFFFLEFRVASFIQYWLHSLGDQKWWPTLWTLDKQVERQHFFRPVSTIIIHLKNQWSKSFYFLFSWI